MVKDNYTGDITQGKARGGPGAMEVVVGDFGMENMGVCAMKEVVVKDDCLGDIVAENKV
jgi:hypothetical protein